MTDVLTKEQRSYNMSRIRTKNTIPEKKLIYALKKAGIHGYRAHYPLFGKPDIVFPKKGIVIFLDGCFWHKCPKHYKEPETKRVFWMKKIIGNVKRDKIVSRKLSSQGYNVLRFWEHDIEKRLSYVIKKISAVVSRTIREDSFSKRV